MDKGLARFGRDLLLDRFGDVVMNSDGDLEVASGEALVAQDVRTELMLSPGSCFWAPKFGRGLGDALRGPKSFDVEGVLRSAAFNDERVLFDSIATEKLDEGHYQLRFQLLDDVDRVELLFDLKERFDDVDK